MSEYCEHSGTKLDGLKTVTITREDLERAWGDVVQAHKYSTGVIQCVALCKALGLDDEPEEVREFLWEHKATPELKWCVVTEWRTQEEAKIFFEPGNCRYSKSGDYHAYRISSLAPEGRVRT